MNIDLMKDNLRAYRKHLLIGGGLALLLLLVGCPFGKTSAVQRAIKDNLKDPGSAQFGETTFSNSGDRACAEWNARNGFGGYGEGSVAELVKTDNGWSVVTMEGGQCDEASFAIADARDEASKEAVGLFLLVAADAPQCLNLQSDYERALGDRAEYKLRLKQGNFDPEWNGDLKDAPKRISELEKRIKSGKCEH